MVIAVAVPISGARQRRRGCDVGFGVAAFRVGFVVTLACGLLAAFASVASAAAGWTAYVANFGNFDGTTVTPIDLATNTAGTPITVGSDPYGVAITPQQAPAAAFTATAEPAGAASSFNGSGSSAHAGATVARYDWSFGDGTSALGAGPTPTHTYSKPGSYTVSLTVTDSTGCSTSVVFTGQTASCNGGPSATKR
jgi:PKD repeat protein